MAARKERTEDMRKLLLASTVAAALTLLPLDATAAMDASMTGVGNPSGNTTNNAAMDDAFGAGNWDLYRGFTMTPFTDGTTAFVFLHGGDMQANQMRFFLAANFGALESFVVGGGRAFLNAAPNDGSAFSIGFGVTLNDDVPPTSSSTATVTPAGIAAGLRNGGLPAAQTGNLFSHATVSGSLTELISGKMRSILGVLSYGSGLAMFGGQTTANFHGPQPQAVARSAAR